MRDLERVEWSRLNSARDLECRLTAAVLEARDRAYELATGTRLWTPRPADGSSVEAGHHGNALESTAAGHDQRSSANTEVVHP